MILPPAKFTGKTSSYMSALFCFYLNGEDGGF